MASYIQKLGDRISPPKWLASNVMFEGVTGSTAYGVSQDSSDMDIVGFCIPPKEIIFPHTAGEIFGFGRQVKRFDQYEQHHIYVPEWKQKFDISMYSIVKFFQLTMENNPNMLDALFLPRRCVLHSTQLYELVRENRHLFLHKGAWFKFRGYSYAQLHKIKNKSNSSNPDRSKSIESCGYDTKFAYHVVRLLSEIEQILVEHDLDLERNGEMLKSIRRGDWTLDDITSWAASKEKDLEKMYAASTLRNVPDEDAIKELLVTCLTMHYGDLSAIIPKPKSDALLLTELKQLVQKYE